MWPTVQNNNHSWKKQFPRSNSVQMLHLLQLYATSIHAISNMEDFVA